MTDKQIIQRLLKDLEVLKEESARLVLRFASVEASKIQNLKSSKKQSKKDLHIREIKTPLSRTYKMRRNPA